MTESILVFFSQIVKNSVEVSHLIFKFQVLNGLKKISIMVLISRRVCSERVEHINIVIE